MEAILEAAAQVFAETGFDNATMDAIAERAESSVGSIYQFFPNKAALFQAIAEACLAKSGDLFETILTPELLAEGWEKILSTFLDGYLEWERNDDYVRAVYSNLHLYGTYEEADLAMMKTLVDRTSDIIGAYIPDLKPAKRKLVATTIVNVATGFLFLARTASDKKAKQLLEETKILLIRYLRPYVEGDYDR